MSGVYDDERAGMMRVHIAQHQARALEAKYTMAQLRLIARDYPDCPKYRRKHSLAVALAFAGVKP